MGGEYTRKFSIPGIYYCVSIFPSDGLMVRVNSKAEANCLNRMGEHIIAILIRRTGRSHTLVCVEKQVQPNSRSKMIQPAQSRFRIAGQKREKNGCTIMIWEDGPPSFMSSSISVIFSDLFFLCVLAFLLALLRREKFGSSWILFPFCFFGRSTWSFSLCGARLSSPLPCPSEAHEAGVSVVFCRFRPALNFVLL